MRKIAIILILIFSSSDCKLDFWKKKIYDNYKETVSSVGDLNDETVLKYIKVVRELHKLGPSIPEKIAGREGDPEVGEEVFSQIEKIIKDGGFKDYTEFVKVNAKVAWAWNVSQGEKGIQDFQTMKDIGVSKIKEALANPNIPEETKVELRKTLAALIDNPIWSSFFRFLSLTRELIKSKSRGSVIGLYLSSIFAILKNASFVNLRAKVPRIAVANALLLFDFRFI